MKEKPETREKIFLASFGSIEQAEDGINQYFYCDQKNWSIEKEDGKLQLYWTNKEGNKEKAPNHYVETSGRKIVRIRFGCLRTSH